MTAIWFPEIAWLIAAFITYYVEAKIGEEGAKIWVKAKM